MNQRKAMQMNMTLMDSMYDDVLYVRVCKKSIIDFHFVWGVIVIWQLH